MTAQQFINKTPSEKIQATQAMLLSIIKPVKPEYAVMAGELILDLLKLYFDAGAKWEGRPARQRPYGNRAQTEEKAEESYWIWLEKSRNRHTPLLREAYKFAFMSAAGTIITVREIKTNEEMQATLAMLLTIIRPIKPEYADMAGDLITELRMMCFAAGARLGDRPAGQKPHKSREQTEKEAEELYRLWLKKNKTKHTPQLRKAYKSAYMTGATGIMPEVNTVPETAKAKKQAKQNCRTGKNSSAKRGNVQKTFRPVRHSRGRTCTSDPAVTDGKKNRRNA